MFVEKQTREKVEAAKPIQDHANRRDPTRMRICVRHNLPDENFHRVARKSSPLERHGNVHRGAFKGDRAEFAFEIKQPDDRPIAFSFGLCSRRAERLDAWGRRLSAPLRASASHAGGAHLHPEPATESCSSVAPRSKQHRARHVTCHHAVGEARQADQGVEARRGKGCEEGAQGEGGDGVAVHHAQCRAEQASAQARGLP